MHCKVSKAPKTPTKYILGLNKDGSTEKTTKLANQSCFLLFYPAYFVKFSQKMIFETFYATNMIQVDQV